MTKLRAGRSRNSGSISGRDKGLFFWTDCPDRFWVALSCLLVRPGTDSVEVKRLEDEAGHPLISSVEANTEWSCTSTALRLNELRRDNLLLQTVGLVMQAIWRGCDGTG